MPVSLCCVLRCRRPATVVHEVQPKYMDTETALREGRVRRYEVCDDHDADYFGRGRGRFLSSEQLDRIRRDLVPR
jgi:hypothetical protein